MWVFDVDGCLIDSLTGTSLRPGTAALPAHLRDAGCTILVWSAGGAPYARRRAEEHGVAHLVDGFHGKDSRVEHGAYHVRHLAHAGVPLVLVDDRPEDLPSGTPTLRVLGVAPYLADNPHDRAFARVAQQAGLATPER